MITYHFRDPALDANSYQTMDRICFPHAPAAREQIEWVLETQGYWAARDNGDFVGMVIVTQRSESLYINRLMVGQDHRRKGIGAGLIDCVRCYAIECELSRLALSVFQHNTNAISLYETAGFTLTGKQNHTYRVNPQDIAPCAECEIVREGEGRRYGVSFYRDEKLVGTGVYSEALGGCRRFRLHDASDYPAALCALKSLLRPGQSPLFIMTDQPEIISAFDARGFQLESAILDMEMAL